MVAVQQSESCLNRFPNAPYPRFVNVARRPNTTDLLEYGHYWNVPVYISYRSKSGTHKIRTIAPLLEGRW